MERGWSSPWRKEPWDAGLDDNSKGHVSIRGAERGTYSPEGTGLAPHLAISRV